METPGERRLLETISSRSKKDETRKIMAIDPHHKHFERFLYVASQAHGRELKRIERMSENARKNQRQIESICPNSGETNCNGADSVCPSGEPLCDRMGRHCSKASCRNFPCERPTSGAVQRGAGFNTATDVDLKVYERLYKVKFELYENGGYGSTIRRPKKSPMDRRLEQELRLKQNILCHQRMKKEKAPKDWFTNYGNPVSSRKIMNVPRP